MSQLVPKSKSMQSVQDLILSKPMLSQLALALPKHITPERMARIVLTQIRLTPKLLECSRESLLGAIMQCAQLGLEPGILGQAWILPYGKEAVFIAGYRGLVQCAWKSNLVCSIAARAVFEGDTFHYDFGSDKLSHKPSSTANTDPKSLTHAWARIGISVAAGSGMLWDVMPRHDIEKVRERSRAKTGPWLTDYAEMAKKTVLRRVLKLAPASVELQRALALDEAAEQGLPQVIDFELPKNPGEAEDPEPKGEETPAEASQA